jgi:hypothetical protein
MVIGRTLVTMSEAERRPARAAGAAAGLVGTGVAVALAAIVSTIVRSFPVLVVADR